ncbi:uncharacterized protein LOC119982943 isoform X1 [Tripterygium wilfordii]|uniref:uncharacterized protein LOC119982943 isoform X1 n=1 Tax=Tripterygium wilfordii TaxID=458696 RepID=UPI0018F83689|nr:uncharacterized protein LOC119982943 isoform X1 [Tripterygium wilfordii]
MGIQKELLRPGTGPKPAVGQTVTVHCTGYGKNGDLSQKFWSTKDPGQQPFSFEIGKGRVIKVKCIRIGFWECQLNFSEQEQDGMKVYLACKWVKLLVYGALQTMLMVPVDFQHGEYNPIQSLFLRLRS